MVVTPPSRSFFFSSLKRISKTEQRVEKLGAGRCPHCRLLFVNPVSLQCGHSLCASCCDELLQRDRRCLEQFTPHSSQPPPTPTRASVQCGTPKSNRAQLRSRRTPLMGLKLLDDSGDCPLTLLDAAALRTPSCPACGAAASSRPPIKNHALAQLLRHIHRRPRKSTSTYLSTLPEELHRPVSPALSSTSSGFHESDGEFGIRKCTVQVLGAHGVGKTQLARTQYLNNLFFGRENDQIKPVTDFAQSRAKYMLNIQDELADPNTFAQRLVQAHGFVLLYGVDDCESLKTAKQMAQQIISIRSDNPAIILAATKCDLVGERKVSISEGQLLANNLSVPFLEVSAKENIGVNELFTKLIGLVDAKPKERTGETDSE